MADYFEGKVQAPSPPAQYARVHTVHADGLLLQLPSGEVTKKKCLCAAGRKYCVGDTVKISKIGGNYIAEFVIGQPG